MIGWHHNYLVFGGSNNIFADFTILSDILHPKEHSIL